MASCVIQEGASPGILRCLPPALSAREPGMCASDGTQTRKIREKVFSAGNLGERLSRCSSLCLCFSWRLLLSHRKI
ncbi:hypothetical protein GRJ2_001887000 [Grus japonensis]|uniref:Uncharacterized protein n=1 Tax=Grus japonensis TaxID=30415 RepID=A0ABC9XBT6_GRUJA